MTAGGGRVDAAGIVGGPVERRIIVARKNGRGGKGGGECFGEAVVDRRLGSADERKYRMSMVRGPSRATTRQASSMT